ncbi:MAG: SidA/IucD/PvdA family monooxygenase [Streptosporangiales bacterium]|nr:SidA/IucD/PvdA family monooxygenase [Streptosporangiales bacterium]
MGQQTDARTEVAVAVLGAGQAGLSSAYFLRRFGFTAGDDFVVLDADDAAGGAWQHRARSLTMHKVHGIFSLPGMAFQPSSAADGRPVADVVPEYFAAYERRFELPVRRPVRVHSVRDEGRLVVATDAGEWSTRAVINSTGTWRRPHWPYYPGVAEFAGRQLHYADYTGPDEFAGLRVAVIGGGHSATHVLSEVSTTAASVHWFTRRPPAFRDDEFTLDEGRNAVALVEERVRAGLPPQSVVSITGLPYTTVVRDALAGGALDRLPMFARVTETGVAWTNGRQLPVDVIVWCTGFRAALDHLAPLRLREHGGGIKLDGIRVVADSRVHLVGYGPSASTIGANRAGRTAAREVRDLLTIADTAAA